MARLARVSHFAGRVVTGVRNAERLIARADPRSSRLGHDLWVASRHRRLPQRETGGRAACRQRPDESDCRTSCINLTYAGRDIDRFRERLTPLDPPPAIR